ncbi:MAG TPA: hypothetical protein VHN78_16015 [Chloroflexota bacterium]|nr:hypothetical protein [Chloroflexota bacterium]
MASDADDRPVDLDVLRRAAGPVIAWYERFLAREPMPLSSLDRALGGLRALPPVSGRLGRAMALVATGGRQATTEETIAALELLRSSTGLRHAPQPAPAEAPKSRRRRGRASWTQQQLPGLDGQ